MILFEAEEMNAKEFLLLSHSPNLRVVASTTSILIAVIFAGVKFSKRAVRFEFMLTCFFNGTDIFGTELLLHTRFTGSVME